MTRKVQERPAFTVPTPGSEAAFLSQLQALFQEYGIAINDILGETGTFTPTFTFDIPGDLSVVYTRQVGKYWLAGSVVHVTIDMPCTPTFTGIAHYACI